MSQHSEPIRQALMAFLDWYDPEAKHCDIGLSGFVDDFMKEKGL